MPQALAVHPIGSSPPYHRVLPIEPISTDEK